MQVQYAAPYLPAISLIHGMFHHREHLIHVLHTHLTYTHKNNCEWTCVCVWERLTDRKIDLGKSSSWRLPRHLLICPSIIDTPSLYKPAEFFMSRALHLLRVECLQSGKYPIFTPCCVCHFLPSPADTLHEGSCLQRAGSLRISVRAGRACDALRYILRCVSAWGGFCNCFDTIYASRNCSSSFFKLTDSTVLMTQPCPQEG